MGWGVTGNVRIYGRMDCSCTKYFSSNSDINANFVFSIFPFFGNCLVVKDKPLITCQCHPTFLPLSSKVAYFVNKIL